MTTDKETLDDAADMLVVIGSSAGGIEALIALLGALARDFPAPVVLAQHLDPHRPSNLAAVLERRSVLPVVEVGAATRLVPGTVYVVPSNRHVVIVDHTVGLEDDRPERPRPSVDLLLTTAAVAYGEHLVAVILTGNGSDGAAGAVEVKKAGGTVVIQNPQTARHPSMPLALPPTAVDYVVDLEGLAPLLRDLVRHVEVPAGPQRDEDALRDILRVVSRHTNIDFSPYKPTTILRRIARRMAVTHQATLREYAQALDASAAEVAELVMSLLIKVTEFLRDPEAFAYLRAEVLPRLIERGRAGARVLRFWSAGCATGEEPYSLALLLADQLGAELPEWNIKIFATDLDESAIAFARRGIYPSNVLGHLPEGFRERFFETGEAGCQIAKSLRQMVIFGQQDLSRGVPFPRIDLVVCRNLLIYFKPELQQAVLELFAYSIQQVGGYLFLGKAETARPTRANFELVDKRWKVYQAAGVPPPLSAVAPRGGPPASAVGGRSPGAPAAGARRAPAGDKGAAGADDDFGQLRRFSELVLRLLPVGVVALDRSYRILTVNAAARRLFGIRDVAYDQDFLHAVRSLPYAQVRAAIDAVFRERIAVSLPDLEIEVAAGSEARFVNLSVALLQVEAGGPEVAVVSVADATEVVQTRRQLESAQTEHGRLLSEISTANRRLTEVNKDIQDANEELQATNEEMMLTQEELQATNEELEATNEELQATNEELETNNEELQATNEELEATNDELMARTGELQESTSSLTAERLRLTEMVQLAPFYILVARGPSLVVEAINPRYAKLVAGRVVLGRPIEEFFRGSEMAPLIALAREAYWQDAVHTSPRMRVSVAAEGAAGSVFMHTIVPIHDGAGRVDGVVIYAEDLTALMARDTTARRMTLEAVVERADPMAMALFDARTGELLRASGRYLDVVARVHGRPREALAGRPWRELAVGLTPDEADAHFREACQDGAPRHLGGMRAGPPGAAETTWDCSLNPIAGPDAELPEAAQYIIVSMVEVPVERTAP